MEGAPARSSLSPWLVRSVRDVVPAMPLWLGTAVPFVLLALGMTTALSPTVMQSQLAGTEVHER